MNGFTITAFLMSLLNLSISFLFRRFCPKEINGIVGYRTPRSMRSQEAWDFANSFSSQFMFRCAVVAFGLQFLFYLVLDSEIALLVFTGFWIASLLFTILITESMLKRNGFK